MSEILKDSIGENAGHAISMILSEEGDLATGNVLRRTCQIYGKNACKQVCKLKDDIAMFDEEAASRELVMDAQCGRSCADINLQHAIGGLGLETKDVLMVGVTADEVGFGDKIPDYDVAGKLSENHLGWLETSGFNAFFAREGEVEAIGRRLADCADINFEFKDSEGATVIGFEHGTRTNMFGPTDFAFEQGGKKVSYTEHVLTQAIEHYGADPDSVRIKLAAAIKGENNSWNFEDVYNMERLLPGWQYAGHAVNVVNAEWAPSADGELDGSDEWHVDTRALIVRDIQETMQNLGIPEANFSMDGIIDPSESGGVFSSHKVSHEGQKTDTRDLYITYVKNSGDVPTAKDRIAQAKLQADEVLQRGGEAAELIGELRSDTPDAAEMIFGSDAGLRGKELVEYWDTIGSGEGGFYDDIRKNGCSSCGEHTPGCCDGCA